MSCLSSDRTRLSLKHVFAEPIINWKGSDPKPSREKNWAFFEHEGRLLIIWKSIPCTVVFAVGAASNNYALSAVTAVCYTNLAKHNALKPLTSSAHGSGHPVLWERETSKEYLLMVHTRHGDAKHYRHYLLRLDYRTLHINMLLKPLCCRLGIIASRDLMLTFSWWDRIMLSKLRVMTCC